MRRRAPMSIDDPAPHAPVHLDGVVPMDHMTVDLQSRDFCSAIGMILRAVYSLDQYELLSYVRISQARFMCEHQNLAIPHNSGELATPIASYVGNSQAVGMRGYPGDTITMAMPLPLQFPLPLS